MSPLTIHTFFQRYPTEAACFDALIALRYPRGIYCVRCQKITRFTKLTKRPIYQCTCGYQVSPLVGTIFAHTHLPLQYWFLALFFVSASKTGVSAKHIQRLLGISYAASYRMGMAIRTVMTPPPSVQGTVEIDETYVGGKNQHRAMLWHQGKAVLFGAVERKGNAILTHVPSNTYPALHRAIHEKIIPGSRIVSDQYIPYRPLKYQGYQHDTVLHQKEYVVHGTDIHTQNAECLWSNFKRSLHGSYRNVSKKYLQRYADEFAWKYNHRHVPDPFEALLREAATVLTSSEKGVV